MIDRSIHSEIIEFLESPISLKEINDELFARTGIETFFSSFEKINEFKNFFYNFNNKNSKKLKELGDFQTPASLTDKICSLVKKTGFEPDIIIEPTCGAGNFIISSLKFFDNIKYIYAVEIQPEYEWIFKLNILNFSFQKNISAEIEFHIDNIFTHKISNRLESFIEDGSQNLLIIGNPPWITNSALSMLNSRNLPQKFNFKKYRGIDAITGKGNFDIAESIILNMIEKFSYSNAKIAMLCKTSVIRNIVKSMKFFALELSDIKAYTIDSKKEFNISAHAAVLIGNLGKRKGYSCDVYSLYNEKKYRTFGWFNGKFVSNIEEYKKHKYIDGNSPFIWRSGIKHDAAKVMELRVFGESSFRNGLDEIVTFNNKELIYPFLKGSQLREPIVAETSKRIIITQSYPSENTAYIKYDYPEIWEYLSKHSNLLSNRKSSIYKDKSEFSIFGVGEYSFKPYKIAISALYKKPRFSLVLPFMNKPVMLDDTCYFISFDELSIAVYAWILLYSDEVYNFLNSIVFEDTKRPYTKEILMRIDLSKLILKTSFDDLRNIYNNNLKKYFLYELSEIEYENFIETIMKIKNEQNKLYFNSNQKEKLLI